MHPDLSPHLHSRRCNDIIKAYHQCHKDFPFKKFLGQCNDFDRAMNKCLKEERVDKRRVNQEKVQKKREEFKNYKLVDEEL